MSYQIKSQAVMDLAGWAPTGDLIDHSWFRYDRRKNKPYYQAILLLGRITYMFRPVDVLDPRNQLVVGRAQKFEADLWQQSRRSLAAYFGMSMNDVDAALEALKRIGVIWTELRTIVVKGQRMSNTMYIGLNTMILREISTPMVLQTHSYTSAQGELSDSSTIAMGLQRDTNTEITQKITQKNRSRAAAGKSRFSAKQIISQAIREAITALPPALQRDACQIAHEEAEAGDEVIVSNFQSQEAREWCASEEGRQFLHLFKPLPESMLSEKDRESRERLQRERLNQQRQELLNTGLMDSPHDYDLCPQMSTNVVSSA
jgi:hypothetical protein